MTRPRQDYDLTTALRDYIDAVAAYRIAAGYHDSLRPGPSGIDPTEVAMYRANVAIAENVFLDRLEDFVVRRSPHHTHPHQHVMGTTEHGGNVFTSRER